MSQPQAAKSSLELKFEQLEGAVRALQTNQEALQADNRDLKADNTMLKEQVAVLTVRPCFVPRIALTERRIVSLRSSAQLQLNFTDSLLYSPILLTLTGLSRQVPLLRVHPRRLKPTSPPCVASGPNST